MGEIRLNKNSLETFKEYKKNKGTTDKELILDTIRYFNNTNIAVSCKDLEQYLNKKHQTVSARLNELMYDDQRIKISYIKDNVAYYVLRGEQDPLNERPMSLRDKLNMLIKEYKDNNKEFIPVDELTKLI